MTTADDKGVVRGILHVANLDEIRDAHVLSDDERGRADLFHHATGRNRYVAGRTFLRTTLSRHIEVPAADIRFVYGETGKPALENASVHFNLSHSRNIAVLGVANVPIGVDVEYIDDIDNLESTSGVALRPAERTAVFAATGRERLLRFYRFWTLKEAVAKAIGSGVGVAAGQIEITWQDDAAALLQCAGHSVDEWSLFTPDINDALCVAIAMRHARATIEIRND
jgi:4'-phosphopantetheinyl transferase